MSLSKYDDDWAEQVGCDHEHQYNVLPQILVGCDMAHLFPVSVLNPDDTPVQTVRARLLRSMITGKYLLFGSAEPNDPILVSSFPNDSDDSDDSDDSENLTISEVSGGVMLSRLTENQIDEDITRTTVQLDEGNNILSIA